jgi:hypothetical protein
MDMRWWFGIFLAALVASPAAAIEGLVIGISADEVLSCGSFFVGEVHREGKTFYKFAQVLTSEGSKPAPAGLPVSEYQNGCEASVGIENGRVTSVTTKQFSDSLMACFACMRLFSECKYLRR